MKRKSVCGGLRLHLIKRQISARWATLFPAKMDACPSGPVSAQIRHKERVRERVLADIMTVKPSASAKLPLGAHRGVVDLASSGISHFTVTMVLFEVRLSTLSALQRALMSQRWEILRCRSDFHDKSLPYMFPEHTGTLVDLIMRQHRASDPLWFIVSHYSDNKNSCKGNYV